MFVEPVQGNGGIVVPPPEYFPRLREVLDEFEVLLIADEVQTGLGRTGALYAMDHCSVQPDIVTGGKALGGGCPIGYFSTTGEIAASYTRPGASTFGGNPVTAQAALTFLTILRRDRLAERSAELGAILKERLLSLQERVDWIEEVRGLGLMVGMEIRGSDRRAAPELTDVILERMKDAGFLIGKTGPGRNVLTFMPPLIIERSELEEAFVALEEVLDDL